MGPTEEHASKADKRCFAARCSISRRAVFWLTHQGNRNIATGNNGGKPPPVTRSVTTSASWSPLKNPSGDKIVTTKSLKANGKSSSVTSVTTVTSNAQVTPWYFYIGIVTPSGGNGRPGVEFIGVVAGKRGD